MRKLLVIILAVCLLVTVGACSTTTTSNTTTTPNTTATSSTTATPTQEGKIVVTVGLAPSAILSDAGSIEKFQQVWEMAAGGKYTIKVSPVTGDNFPNAMLQNFATGSGFDVYMHWGPADCLNAGITTDMTTYVENWVEYNNGNVRKEIVDLWKMGGKFRMLPAEEGWKLALIYRKDWLDTLKMKPPATLDEFKTVAYAMAQSDPDGNGKDDTFGLAIESDSTWNMGNLIYAFGADNYFDMTDSGYSTAKGYLKNDALLKEITMYRDMYKDKVLNPNSFTTPNVTGEFEAGKTGMFFMDTAWIAGELDEKLGADSWDVVPVFNKLHNGGSSLGISIVAENKGKAQMDAAWEVLKAWYTPEMQLTLAFGFEGEGWSNDGSAYKFIAATSSGSNITGNIRSDLNLYELSGVANDPKQAYHALPLPVSGGHLNYLPNREKIERRMDATMAKVAMGEMTPEQGIEDLNTFIDEAFKEIGVE